MAGVAVIGNGGVGRAIATALRRGGRDVTVGVRVPSAADERPVAEAIAAADVVVVAIPGSAVEELAAEHARRHWRARW